MSIEKVREELQPLGMAERIRELELSSATVELAAIALGVDGARIAKSMGFLLGEKAILVVTAGDRKINSSKFKARFGAKPKFLTFAQAHDMLGHDPGGVCPFALPEGVAVYLDESLRRFATVFPAAGSANSAIEMTCDELARCASGFSGWVDVCKPKDETV
ncbi:MAG: YbaK/EbsC family protein [Oscillospiraceae bacterium]|nr:YbaK/EbsC family protein [Oscillospiraceae bacterium]